MIAETRAFLHHMGDYLPIGQIRDDFLREYLQSFSRIEGWFSFDAAMLFMAFNELLEEQQQLGHTLEIGVHHGLSSIAIASLRGEDSRFVAVDLFEALQDLNVSGSGHGRLELFHENFAHFFRDSSFLDVISNESAALNQATLGSGFTFCHIDGGHSRAETYHDLDLCYAITEPGGLIALDDYFNPKYPGVCEGAAQFMLQSGRRLRPLAIAYNKVVFQRTEDASGFLSRFRHRYPTLRFDSVDMWGGETLLIRDAIRTHFDLARSTPRKLVASPPFGTSAELRIEDGPSEVVAGETIHFRISITNTSGDLLPSGEKQFGLSYHLLTVLGKTISHDNPRLYLDQPLLPQSSVQVLLPVIAPSDPGHYLLAFDLVWEGVTWFAEAGNHTPAALLHVLAR